LPAARGMLLASLKKLITISSSNHLLRKQLICSKSSGIIIIGDEILKGQTQDTNTFFLAKNLRNLGVNVERVSVIPDDLETIATEIKDFSEKFDYVITSGGIGPTHDDITFEGVAKAFSDDVHHHPQIVKFCKAWFKTEDLTNPCFKLALIPKTAKLNFGVDKRTGKPTIYPLVSVKNVFIFPGIPELLQKAFTNLGPDLFGSDSKFYTGECFIDEHEIGITKRLNHLVSAHPSVTFGSYPAWTNSYYRTRISIECSSPQLLEQIQNQIAKAMPVVTYDPDPTENAMDKIHKFISDTKDEAFKEALEKGVGVVEECLKRYSPEEVCVCFNGGKDCIVMLHLVWSHFQKHFPKTRLKTLYIKEKESFEEVDEFIEKSVEGYGLDNTTLEGPIKTALAVMIKKSPGTKAFVLGTRDGDPGSQYLDHFSPTDGDWPRIMRVNPILHWRYKDVWTFIRNLSLPYPSLYDQGYTSLGNPSNTLPNPALRCTDDQGQIKYKPAYQLQDGTLEREGRKAKT